MEIEGRALFACPRPTLNRPFPLRSLLRPLPFPRLRTPGRDAFLGQVWEWVDQYGHRIHDQLRRLGSSVDWSRSVFTMDDKLSVSGMCVCMCVCVCVCVC